MVSKKIKIALLVLYLVAMVYSFFYQYTRMEELKDHKEQLQQIESLQQQNDSLTAINGLLDQQNASIKIEIDSLKQQLSSNQEMTNDLKKKRHEKTKIIDTYSNDKLYSFFTRFNTDSTAVRE